MLNIVGLLHGIPKYRARFERKAPNWAKARDFSEAYSSLIAGSNAVKETISTKQDIAVWLKTKGLEQFDIGGIPQNAKVAKVDTDFENPKDPVLIVTYEDPEVPD
jgi:hypothetical protein